jgi:hypothetical protein
LRSTVEVFGLADFAGVFTAYTDYGTTASNPASLFGTTASGSRWAQFLWGKGAWGLNTPDFTLTTGFIWGEGVWGTAVWAQAPQYFKQRFDLNLQGEAFAFGFATPAATLSTAPWRFMGASGRIAQSARN